MFNILLFSAILTISSSLIIPKAYCTLTVRIVLSKGRRGRVLSIIEYGNRYYRFALYSSSGIVLLCPFCLYNKVTFPAIIKLNFYLKVR